MATWRNTTNLMSLLALLITVNPSKEDCPHYFQFEDLKQNVMEEIPLIKTKDPKDQLKCSLKRTCQIDKPFCAVLYHCFGHNETNEIRPECEGESDQSVSHYIFMCKVAAHINLPTNVCRGFDVVCPSSPHHSTIATPTTLSESTTAPLEPNAASVQPSKSTNATSTSSTSATSTSATSTNAHGSSDGHISNNNSTVNSGWFGAFLFTVTLCMGLVALYLYTWRRNKQLSETINLMEMKELQSVAVRADANGNESAILIQPEAPLNDAPVTSGSLQ